MAKWDIKDGFWRLDGQNSEEWNFAYVLLQPPLELVQIVVPTSLQKWDGSNLHLIFVQQQRRAETLRHNTAKQHLEVYENISLINMF